MAVESADDLEGFFDPDEFGEAMVAITGLAEIAFNGIYTDSPLAETPGTMANITGYVPRIIASKTAVSDLQQGDLIRRADGTQYQVNTIEIKNSLLIIFLHDVW